MVKGLVTAIRTLTIIPIPGKDAHQFARALPWFPIVGCLLGGALFATSKLVDMALPERWPEGAAILIVGLGLLLSKGLHLDGLADFADAFGNWHDKKKTLDILKDPHVGAFGVAAVVIVLLLKWICLTKMIASGAHSGIIAAYIVSRTMQVEMAATYPNAREEGIAAPFMKDVRPYHRIIALASAAWMLLVFQGLPGFFLLAIGFIICKLLGFWSSKRINGVTGDVLGACSELVETIVFLCFAAFQGKLTHGYLGL
jgi:adenosylcobinamide-GDP ribazoletransferase